MGTIARNTVRTTSLINQTLTPLNNGETFTGTWELNPLDQVMVSCITDTSGVLYFDFSNDESRVLTFPSNGFSVAANIHEFQVAVKGSRWFRVRFENDSGSNQTFLELYTYYGQNFVPAVTPLNQNVGLDQAAIFTRGTVPQDDIRIGKRGGVAGWTKFAYREGLTAAGGEEMIWATTGNFTPMTSADTFTVTYNNTTDGDGTTGALTLYCQYVDANGLPAVAVHTLGSSGSDTTSFTGLGFNRVAVSSAGSNQVNANDITVTATTAGTTQAFVPASQGVTQQAIYHTGANHDAVAKFLWINILKLSGGGSPRVSIKGYVFNRPLEIRFEVFRCDIDTASENVMLISEPIGFNLSPSDVLYFVADTDTNNTNVNMRFSLNEYQRS